MVYVLERYFPNAKVWKEVFRTKDFATAQDALNRMAGGSDAKLRIRKEEVC